MKTKQQNCFFCKKQDWCNIISNPTVSYWAPVEACYDCQAIINQINTDILIALHNEELEKAEDEQFLILKEIYNESTTNKRINAKQFCVKNWEKLFPIKKNIPKVIWDYISNYYEKPNKEQIITALNNEYFRQQNKKNRLRSIEIGHSFINRAEFTNFGRNKFIFK